MTFTETATRFEPFNPANEPAFVAKMGVKRRLQEVLKHGPKTAVQLAGALDEPVDKIRVTLSQGKGDWAVQLNKDGAEYRWGAPNASGSRSAQWTSISST